MSEGMICQVIEQIHHKSLRIAVLGSGHVGLPTAALFADAGFCVVAFDLRLDVVKAVNKGVSPLKETGLQELVLRNVQINRLRAALNTIEPLSKEDIFIISVQTPIDINKKPDLTFLVKAIKDIGESLKKGTIVIINSTVPPTTLTSVVKPRLESISGLKADDDFYLAYVPERIAPGKALQEFVESPRLVGGIGPHSTRIAAELFRTVCKKIVQTNATTAEIAKLAENTFRDVNIAFANQLSLICEHCGVDVIEAIKLANTHPRVNIHMPGPGVGGPCLPKDPYLLLDFSSRKDHKVIAASRRMNDSMPKHIVKSILQALKRTGKNVQTCKIAILGTAYKGDVDDARSSPAKPIINELKRLGARIVVYDPNCRESLGAKRACSPHEALKGVDCVAIITDHTAFKNLKLEEVKKAMNDKPVIIDGRRIVNPHEAEDLGFFYYGIGYGASMCAKHVENIEVDKKVVNRRGGVDKKANARERNDSV